MRRNPTLQRTLDRRYPPPRLIKAQAADVGELAPVAKRLKRWALGIVVGATLFVAAALSVHGWHDSSRLPAIMVIGALSFLWAYCLHQASRRATLLQHAKQIWWLNSVVLLAVTTAMMSMTGASLSPLFWLYLILIGVEMVQDRRRGLVVSWLSWLLFSGLLIAQERHALPDALSGWSSQQHLLGTAWRFYALGINLGYLVTAITLTRLSRWLGRQERTVRERLEMIGQREQLVAVEQEQLQAGRRETGQQVSQLDQARRQLEDERKRWEQERQQRESQRSQRAQEVAVKEAAAVTLARESEERVAQLQTLQQQLEEERNVLAQQREHTAKMLEDQEAVLAERMRELDEARQQFEAQRAHTTQSLRELEATLMARLKHVDEDVGQIKAERLELEQAQQELATARATWDDQRARVSQELQAKAEEQQVWEMSRAQMEARFNEQAAALATREATLEAARHAEETTHSTRDSSKEQQIRVHADELRKTRQQLELAKRQLVIQQRAYEAQRRKWQHTQQIAEEKLASRAQAFLEQQRTLETHQQALERDRQALEHAQGRATEQLHQQEQNLVERVRQLDERHQQLSQLQEQLAQERQGMEHHRAQFDASRQQLLRDQQQLKTVQHRSSSPRAPHQEPATVPSANGSSNGFSPESLTLLANELHSPLTSLQALLATLLEGDLGEISPKILDALRTMKKTNEHVRRMMADVLDVASLEHGQLPVAVQTVSLHDLLARSEQDIQEELKRKQLSFMHQGDDTAIIAVDPTHAHRILAVLLRNAVHYTEQGGITVTCSAQPDHVTITIADTGVGLQPGQTAQLFSKPVLGSLLRRKGMSLYLVHGLAKAMGGGIRLVSSELEGGSVFAVTLPRRKWHRSPMRPSFAQG